MNAIELTVQDLMDLLHIGHERVNAYNKIAYTCENLQLKMLLNQEMDQTRDSILAVKKLLHERFDILSEHETKGPLYGLWADFRPPFDAHDVHSQLLDFEMADLLTLQCYCLVITKPDIDSITKNLLEFQYQSTMLMYYNMKAFRHSYQKKRHSVALYPLLKSA
jgi:hypothetical protein